MNEIFTIRQQVSELADGALDEAALARLMSLANDGSDEADEFLAVWAEYHVIGEVLRSGCHQPCSRRQPFIAGLRRRLERETPAIEAASFQAVAIATPAATWSTEVRTEATNEAANEPVFRWKMVAGVASLAAAAAIGWNWIEAPVGGNSPGVQLARSVPADAAASVKVAVGSPARPTAASASEEPRNPTPTLLRDARLDEILAAHEQSARGAQTPSAYLRNATFEQGAR